MRFSGLAVFFVLLSVQLVNAQIDTIFTEDFEGIFPGTRWVVGDSNPNSGEDYWDDVNYRAYPDGGYWSGWCAAIGENQDYGWNNNLTDYDIYDYSCVTSPITINSQAVGSCDIIDSIFVRVVIYHTYRGDLILRLLSPENADTFLLFRRTGGSADNLDTTFVLKGSGVARVDSVNGTWRLVVCDSALDDIGYLDWWSLGIYYHQGNICSHQYDNYMYSYMTTTINFDSLNAAGTDILLSFYHIIPSIETNWDWGAVYIDERQIGPKYSSPIPSWTNVTFNLTDSLSILPVARGEHRLKFLFYSDYSIRSEGWYIDRIQVISRKPNLQPYAAFTGGYIVPSNVTGTQTVSPTLTGNGTTYLDAWTCRNNSSYDATDTIMVRVLLDGEPITTYDRLVPRMNAGDTVFYVDRAITVKGGRHTLMNVVDVMNRIRESDEADNSYSVQFVWSPMTLSQGVPITRTTPPSRGTMHYANCDGFTYPQTNYYWSGCAIKPPADADYDLQLYYIYSNSTSGFDSVLTGSYYGTGQVDFVLRDGNHSTSTNYVGVYNYRGSGNFTIEADYNAESIEAGTNGPYTIGAGNIIRIWDTRLISGTRYSFLLQNNIDGTGDADLDIYLFSSQDGIYTKSRYDYIAYSGSNGPGGDEMFTFTNSGADDWFGFVVVNKGATQPTRYTITRTTTALKKITLIVNGLDADDSTMVRYVLLGNNLTKRVNGTWIGYVDSNSVVSVDGIVSSGEESMRYVASAPHWWIIRADTEKTVNYTRQYRIIASVETSPAGSGASTLNDTNSVSVWSETPSRFEDISNYPGRQEIWNDGANHDDESFGPLPIGFEFPYFGTTYSSLYITSNGFIVLGIAYPASAPIPYEGCLRDGGLFSFAIMAYGADLIYRAGTSRIFYRTLQNPTRLVIQYHNMYHYGETSESCSFEIVLYSTGEIGFYYLSVMPSYLPDEIGISEYGGKYFNDALSTYITSGSGYSLFGSQYRCFDGTTDTLWVSDGSRYHFASISNYSNSEHRWATNMDTTYFASSPTTQNLIYYEQFACEFGASVEPPGIPMAPDNGIIVYANQFGSREAVAFVYDGYSEISWVDAFPADTNEYIYFSPISTGSSSTERWVHSPTGAGSPRWYCNGAYVYEATYYNQLRDIVNVSINPPGQALDAMNYVGLWYSSCGGIQSRILYDDIAESVWVDNGATVKVHYISSGSEATFTGGESGNLAPLATASSSGGGTEEHAIYMINDNDTSTYHWVTPAPGSFIMLEWESEKVIGWMRITTGDCENTLTRGILEYWNGTIWVTIDTIKNEKSSFTYVMRTPVVTTKLRIREITGYGSGERDSLHPKVNEWEIYSTDGYNNRHWFYCGPSSELEFTPSGGVHSFTFYDQILVNTRAIKGNPPACTDTIPSSLLMIYRQCGEELTDTIGKTFWQDTNDTIRFDSLFIEAYSRWVPLTGFAIATSPGEITETYYHQYNVRFNSPVKMNEPACTHTVPTFQVTERYEKGMNTPVAANGTSHWTDCGSHYSYEDPKIVNEHEQWDISSFGEGTIRTATVIEPLVYHQWKPIIFLPGTENPNYLVQTPYRYSLGINIDGENNFGTFEDWVDCGQTLEFAQCTHPIIRCTEDERRWEIISSFFTDTIRYGFFEVMIQTDYAGGQVIVDGDTFPSPYTSIWGPGSVHTIGAISPHTLGTTRKVWRAWSDGGELIHSVVADERTTLYVAYFSNEYLCRATKEPPQNYGSLTINGTIYDRTSSVSFWVPQDSTALIEASEVDYGTVYFYTFSRWSDGGTRSHRTAPITAPTTFTAYYDSTLIQLNIILNRTIWNIGMLDPLTTVVAEDTQMVFITNMGNVPITLGLRAQDSTGVWFASLYPDSNKFVMRALFNDSYAHPPASSFNPIRDVIYSSSTRWASSTVFGPGGYNIPPPPSRENTENLWLMFIAPSYSSDWEIHKIILTVSAKLYLP